MALQRSNDGSAPHASEATTTMEEYDFSYNAKTPTALIRDLATLRFIEHGESVVLHGPVGVR